MPTREIQWGLASVTALFQVVVLVRSLWVPLDGVVPVVHILLGVAWAAHLTVELVLVAWWLELLVILLPILLGLCALRCMHWCCPCITTWQCPLELWTAAVLPWETLVAFRSFVTHRADLRVDDLPLYTPVDREQDIAVCVGGASAALLWLHLLCVYVRQRASGYQSLSV